MKILILPDSMWGSVIPELYGIVPPSADQHVIVYGVILYGEDTLHVTVHDVTRVTVNKEHVTSL